MMFWNCANVMELVINGVPQGFDWGSPFNPTLSLLITYIQIVRKPWTVLVYCLFYITTLALCHVYRSFLFLLHSLLALVRVCNRCEFRQVAGLITSIRRFISPGKSLQFINKWPRHYTYCISRGGVFHPSRQSVNNWFIIGPTYLLLCVCVNG